MAILQLLGAFRIRKNRIWRWFKTLFNGDGREHNNLVQIGTGEGKSIILGIMAIILGLWGFRVDCACYSEYLSQRDFSSFLPLFRKFGVENRIEYDSLINFARRNMNLAGNVRDGSLRLIEGKLKNKPLQCEDTDAHPRVMLLDEVDVFFSKDFLGAIYHPAFVWKNDDIIAIQRWIWEKRGTAELTITNIRKLPSCVSLFQNFPEWTQLIANHISDMIQASTTFNTPDFDYRVSKEGKIGYLDHGVINTSLRRGYNTMFQYFQEVDRKEIDPAQLEEHALGLTINCGQFSYAEILRPYARLFGVSGTLSTLGQFERKIMAEQYQISTLWTMPTFYGRRDQSFFKGVHIEKDENKYHCKIKDEMIDSQRVGSAMIAVFDNIQSMKRFKESRYGQDLGSSISMVDDPDKIEHYVKQATHSGAVTLITQVYGRGIDFVCHDKKVESAGGVRILQTFLSDNISDQKQIEGRTCRQGNNGYYKMVLWAKELMNWKTDQDQAQPGNNDEKKGGADEKKNKKTDSISLGLSEQDIDQLMQKQGMEVYQDLNRRRLAAFDKQAKLRQQAVIDAKALHDKSVAYQDNLVKLSRDRKSCQGKRAENARSFLISLNQPQKEGFLIVFCLDESTSMDGNDWNSLKQATRAFIDMRIGSGSTLDQVCFVQFHTQARTTLKFASLTEAKRHDLIMHGGATAFLPALKQARKLLKTTQTSGLTPLLLFLSDGQDISHATVADFTNMIGHIDADCKSFSPNPLQFHSIFFGQDDTDGVLKAMADHASNGHYHLSVNGIQLAETFKGIASTYTSQL